MIRGIHHPSITTANLDRLIDFYCQVIGFTLIDRFGWENSDLIDKVVGLEGSATRGAMLRAGNCYLELFEYSSPSPRTQSPLRPCDGGYTHICLDVVDIQHEYARLQAAGMPFNTAPESFGELWAAYGRDPDGNIIEIQETLPNQVFALEQLTAVDSRNAPTSTQERTKNQ